MLTTFGSAGQRCMALAVNLFVGESKEWIPDLVERVEKLTVNAGHVKGTNLGAMNNRAGMKRAEDVIQSAIDEVDGILLDGRGVKVEGFPKGNFIGPTIGAAYGHLQRRVIRTRFSP